MNLTLRKVKLGWKYRRLLWKYRRVIRHRKQIAWTAAALAVVGAGVLMNRSRI